MTVKELEEQLSKIEDKSLRIDVSVDVSTGQDDIYNRLFADPSHIQNDGTFITLICEKGEFNYDYDE